MTTHPFRLLVVEDDEEQRRALVIQLRYEGFQVFEAEHGGEAMEQTVLHRPDAIILDLMMPVQDGISFLADLRTCPGLSETCVIVLTASPEKLTAGSEDDLRIHAVLSKPYDLDELLEELETLKVYACSYA